MAESWVQCVTRVYHEKKRHNKSYKFKNAMKDAKKEYKKGQNTERVNNVTKQTGKKQSRHTRRR
jgi:hypothetical protein